MGLTKVKIVKLPDNYNVVNFNLDVDIAECFYYTNETGDQVTTMPLLNYVKLIANQVCINLTAASETAEGLSQMESTLSTLQETIDSIGEAEFPDYTSTVVLPGETTGLENVIRAMETQFGQLRDVTGTPDSLYKAIASQGTAINTEDAFGSNTTMAGLPGWISTVTTLADSVNNLWATVKDLRTGFYKVANTDSSTATCSSISLNFRASVNTSTEILTVYLDGSIIPLGFDDSSSLSTLKVEDGNGNSTTSTISIIDTNNDSSGVDINLGSTMLDITGTLTLTLNSRLTSNSLELTCEQCYTYSVAGTYECPTLTLYSNDDNISYSFTSAVASLSYIIKLYVSGEANAIQTVVIAQPGGNVPVTGYFYNLTASTDYDVEMTLLDSDNNETTCAKQTVTTSNLACSEVSDLLTSLTIT
jgi:hypothetical protein